jgi:hypothetical protein
LELPAALKRREKITPSPRIRSHHHAFPFIRPKHSLIHHLGQHRVGMVHQRLEACRTLVIKSRQYDHQTTTRPQFYCPQREEGFPVMGSLSLEHGALGVCGA